MAVAEMDKTRNRLSIGHLMLWMATTSVVIAEGQWDLSTANLPESLLAEVRLHNLIWSLGFGPLQGLALVGVLIFLWRRLWSHKPFLTEPGHFLLTIAGAERLVSLLTQAAYLLAVRGNESSIPAWANWLSEIAYYGLPILLAIVGACTVRSGWLWRLSILAMGLLGATTILHDVALDWSYTRGLLSGEWGIFLLRFSFTVPGLLAIIAAVVDWRHKQQRDFFHWCGVALVVLGPTVEWGRSFLPN